MRPNLTIGRWSALRALQDQPELHHRPFAARELKIEHRNGTMRPASGATLSALRSAGWAVKVAVDWHDDDLPFHVQIDRIAWRITDDGRKAIALCPKEYPGDPVYGGD